MNLKKWLLLACLVSPPVVAQKADGPPFIAVHGTAKTEVVPDLFPLKLTLQDTSKDLSATQAAIESLARKLLDLAKSQGMADDDVTVGNLSIDPQVHYNDDTEKETFLGNEYKREIKLRFHDLAKLKAFLSALPASKQLRVDTEEFAVSNPEQIQVELTAKAISNARATADEMAKGIGRRIVSVQTISNQALNVRYSESFGYSGITFDRIVVTGTRIRSANAEINLSEGVVKLEQNVYIVYLLSE